MMAFEDVAFQLIDLPPLNEEHVEPWVYDIARRADLLWIVVTVENAVDGLELPQLPDLGRGHAERQGHRRRGEAAAEALRPATADRGVDQEAKKREKGDQQQHGLTTSGS
jgi:hypothetical protein